MNEQWDAGALADRESIKQLKARYCRLIDLKEWDTLAHLFTDDVHVDLGEGRRFAGRDAFMAFVRERFAGATTLHQAHLPEIEVVGPDEATGVWSMEDHVEQAGAAGRPVHTQTYAYHEERYARRNGVWRISRMVVLPVHFASRPTVGGDV